MSERIFSTVKKLARVVSQTLKTQPHRRAPQHKIIHWKETKNQSIFGEKPYLTHKQLYRKLKRIPDNILGIGKISKKEKLSLIDELYSKDKVGTYITSSEYHRGIRELKKQLHRLGSLRKRQEIRKKIKFLKYFKGGQDEK